MSKTYRPVEFTNYELDAAPIEIPPGGVSLKACSFRNLEMAGITIPVLFARGCTLIPPTSRDARFGAGYFGGGEAAGVKPASRRSGCSVCLVKVRRHSRLMQDRHIMNHRRRLAITNSFPVMENWTRVVQTDHFVANRCHTPAPPYDSIWSLGKEGYPCI
jgi:hypothetical protein